MKRTILAVMLTATITTANAEVLATSVNKAGGEIQLTDEVCRIDSRYSKVYSYTSSGTILEGCWNYTDGNAVRVVWTHTNGYADQSYSARMYPLNGFTLTAAGHRAASR